MHYVGRGHAPSLLVGHYLFCLQSENLLCPLVGGPQMTNNIQLTRLHACRSTRQLHSDGVWGEPPVLIHPHMRPLQPKQWHLCITASLIVRVQALSFGFIPMCNVLSIPKAPPLCTDLHALVPVCVALGRWHCWVSAIFCCTRVCCGSK